MISLALFASGAGSNALNLIQHARSLSGIKISCVIVDTKSSPLPDLVRDVPVYRILPRTDLSKEERRAELEMRILEKLEVHQVQYILLAGYMRLIGPTLLQHFKENSIINIHPSLLPLYPGTHSYERAFEDQVKESGITIHFVDAGLDTGPVILQQKFPRLSSDTLDDFIKRGKALEWELYPQILDRLHSQGKIHGP